MCILNLLHFLADHPFPETGDLVLNVDVTEASMAGCAGLLMSEEVMKIPGILDVTNADNVSETRIAFLSNPKHRQNDIKIKC